MGKIGDSFPLTVPAVGTSSASDWAEDINEILEELIDRVDSPIESTSVSVTSDLEFNENKLTEVNSVVYATNEDASRPAGTTYFGADGEFHVVTTDGDIQITDAGNVNSSGGGAISGDASEAVITYSNANQRFTFSDNSSSDLATLRARYFAIANNASGSAYATLAFGGSADVTYTLPDAVPGSTTLLQMDSSGNITTASTVAHAMTVSGVVTAADIDFTTERYRTVYITSTNILASNSLGSTAGTYTHTAGGSSTLTSAYYSFNANGDWVIIDLNNIIDDGDIITGWRLPFKVTGSMTSATIRGSIGVAGADGSFSVPGSLSESDSWTYANTYDEVEYTGVSTVTVDRDGAGTPGGTDPDIVRGYYLILEVTAWSGTGSLDLRTAQVKVKRA